MTKKEYLLQYKDAQKEVDRLIGERDYWISKATKVTASYSGMPNSNNSSSGDKIQLSVEKISEIEEQLNCRIAELIALRQEIDTAIGTIGDIRLETVLRYRYIDGLSFEQIALKMMYSYDHIIRLHGWALKRCRVMP